MINGADGETTTFASEIWAHHNSLGAWEATDPNSPVGPNPTYAKTDLLVEIENGIGGTMSLEYAPSTKWDHDDHNGVPQMPMPLWVVSKIERDSGMAGIAPGSASLSTEIEYAYGQFDGVSREFRGFGTVYTVDGVGTQRTTVFEQDAMRKGKVAFTRVHPPGVSVDDPPLFETENVWACANPATGGAVPCAPQLTFGSSRWPRLTETFSRAYSADGATYKESYRENLQWDLFGNVTKWETGGTGTHRIENSIQYANVDTLDTGGDAYIVDKPYHVTVDQPDPNDPLYDPLIPVEERWFYYDDKPTLGDATKGNVTKVMTWLSESLVPVDSCPTSGSCVTTTTEYNSFGYPLKVFDPSQQGSSTATTTFTYDSTNIHIATTANALGHTVTTTHDPMCGSLLSSSLPDNPSETTRYQYDNFCRLSSTALPGQTVAQPQQSIHYFLNGNGIPSSTLTLATEPSSSTGFVERYDLVDGLGRALQTQEAMTVDGTRRGIASATVGYDAAGRTIFARGPFDTQALLGTTGAGFAAPPETPDANDPSSLGAFVLTEYDALGRATRTLAPDGSETEVDYAVPWEIATKDACYVDSSCTGGMAVEVRNAHGHVVESYGYVEDIGGDTIESGMRSTYDAAGRVVTSEQWGAAGWEPRTKIETIYDSLGRKVQHDDPDSGVWSYGYDAVGNLLYQDDPEPGQHVQLCYDELNRPKYKLVDNDSDAFNGTSACDSPSDPSAIYTYDDAAVLYSTGLLTEVENEHSRASFLYDVQGRVVAEMNEIFLDGTIESVIMYYVYDYVGRLQAIQYPDGEAVTYGFDDTGKVKSVSSGTGQDYIDDLRYDIFGRATEIVHGNGVVEERDFHDSSKLFRLKEVTVDVPAGRAGPPLCVSGTRAIHLKYNDYDPRGLLTQVEDGLDPCDANLQNDATYSYDGLGRLVAVANSPHDGIFEFDGLGNLKNNAGTIITYSPTGPPHQPVSVDDGTGAVAIVHDDNGNRFSKGGESFDFDAEGRLVDAITANGEVLAGYDYAGRKVWQAEFGQTRRYFNRFVEYRINGEDPVFTKHYFVGADRIATQDIQDDVSVVVAFGSFWDGLILFAGGRPDGSVVIALGEPVQAGLLLLFGMGLVGLVAAPRRVRRGAGVRISRGQALVVALVFSTSTLPLPVAFISLTPKVARASGGGSGGGFPPPASYGTSHYHRNHLGSPVLLTDETGAGLQHIRYEAYGRVHNYWHFGAATTGRQTREFTDYETMARIGLHYAGARWYDPATGSFLSHDPEAVFPSPYSYLGGDPVNQRDANGAFPIPVPALVLLGALAVGIDAYIRTGDFGSAMEAFGAGVIIGTASFGVIEGGLALASSVSKSLVPVVEAALVGAAGYGVVESARRGNYVTASFAAAMTAFGVAQGEQEPSGSGSVASEPREGVAASSGTCEDSCATGVGDSGREVRGETVQVAGGGVRPPPFRSRGGTHIPGRPHPPRGGEAPDHQGCPTTP